VRLNRKSQKNSICNRPLVICSRPILYDAIFDVKPIGTMNQLAVNARRS